MTTISVSAKKNGPPAPRVVSIPASTLSQLPSGQPVGTQDLIKAVNLLMNDKQKLEERIERLEAKLAEHIENCTCSGLKRRGDAASAEQQKEGNTKAVLTTFLNTFQSKNNQVFYTCEIKTPVTTDIPEQIHTFLNLQENAELREYSLKEETTWNKMLREMIGGHRNHFASAFRDQILTTLHIPKSAVPWHLEQSPIEKLPKATGKRKQPSDDAAEEQKAVRKIQFMQLFLNATRQGGWDTMTLLLHSLEQMQKTQISHIAYACYVLDRFRQGDPLEKDTDSKPAGLPVYLTNKLLVQDNKCPFLEPQQTLEEAWTKAKSR